MTSTERAKVAAARLVIAHVAGLAIESRTVEQLARSARDEGHLRQGSGTAQELDSRLGCARIRDGDYAGALPYLMNSYEASARLENKSAMARAALNIALCHDRLGDFERSLHWSQIGIGFSDECSEFARFQLTHMTAWAQAMMGKRAEAIRTLSSGKFSGDLLSPPWANQASLLMSSDLWWVVGRTEEALKTATEATHNSGPRPLSSAYAGPFCRSLARLGLALGLERDFSKRIDETAAELRRLDAIDEAEITAASLLLKLRLGESLGDLPTMLTERLSRLPPAVNARLAKLGLSEALQCAACAPK
jgi:hypothetical protein